MSNIEVLVEWGCPTVFAGEEVGCTITFKNLTSTSKQSRSPSPSYHLRNLGNARDRWKLELPKQSPSSASPPVVQRVGASVPRPDTYLHRSTSSLSATTSQDQSHASWHDRRYSEQAISASHKHKKSVSIKSIGQHGGSSEEQVAGTTNAHVRNIRNHHNRSTSFQGLPIRSLNQPTGLLSYLGTPQTMTTGGNRSATSPIPQKRAPNSYKPQKSSLQDFVTHKRVLLDEADSFVGSSAKHTRKVSSTTNVTPDFHDDNTSAAPIRNGNLPSSSAKAFLGLSQGGEVASTKILNRPLQRIVSPINTEETPRSSMDIYSHSNNSSETLASEYVESTGGRHFSKPNHGRQLSRLAPSNIESAQQETLMMGYVQLVGSFTLDGSLINLAPFEPVKRKGVIGGQGSGGVVGVDSSKRDSGLFGSLGWNNIGQSLGGLLGSQEPSSFREMKGIASSKSVPILSTPQSILFVDLKLRPGESKKFSYRQVLPRGIPPTHRGRAFKSTYQLIIGIQRPRSTIKQHVVKQIEVPFKVLPGIDEFGEILGHDLMNPHILLQDMATTISIDDDVPILSQDGQKKAQMNQNLSIDGLTSYVNTLLQGNRQNSGLGLLSPTHSSTPAIAGDDHNEHVLEKELIDLAIARGIPSGDSKKSSCSFQIHRGGDKVATVVLARSAYRVGEVIPAIVDFQNAEILCSTLVVSLETSEVVDPAIALRSIASVHRATRRVHAQDFENTICARRVAFGLMIPVNATPNFVTTGVHLEWKLRFEFITRDGQEPQNRDSIIESVAADERGTISSAIQELACQNFDVSIPIRVYGSTTGTEEDKIAGRFTI